jgi:hypothetical protein
VIVWLSVSGQGGPKVASSLFVYGNAALRTRKREGRSGYYSLQGTLIKFDDDGVDHTHYVYFEKL